jgi:SAM-dependent methyltransferase
MADWWESFFDADYVRLWEGAAPPGRTEREAAGLWALLGLAAGSRVLDAPCGCGRPARALAARGATVLGVDLSAALVAEAERRRGGLPAERLRFERRDLRTPLEASGFDAAINVFSSLGYGAEGHDVRILATLRAAVRPGGLVFVETLHRDRVAAVLSQSQRFGSRLPDGTLIVEEPRLDPIAGRVETVWHWSGPAGSGSKAASIRAYTATELVRLLQAAGLRFRSAHAGCSPDPFPEPGAVIGDRLGLLAVRE